MNGYTIQFDLKSSKYLAIWLAGVHFLALLALMLLQLPELQKFFLMVLLYGHFSVEQRRYAQLNQPRTLIYTEGLGWRLSIGEVIDAIDIQPSTVITTFLIIIHYKIVLGDTRMRSIVCFKDALKPKEFKKLTVQLKMSGLSRR